MSRMVPSKATSPGPAAWSSIRRGPRPDETPALARSVRDNLGPGVFEQMGTCPTAALVARKSTGGHAVLDFGMPQPAPVDTQ